MTAKLRTCIAYGCEAKFHSRDSSERICPACRPYWEMTSAAWGRDDQPPEDWDPYPDEKLDSLELEMEMDPDDVDSDLFAILDEYEADLGDDSPEEEN